VKTIAIISQKGGVGKTTLTINLAAAAQLRSKSGVVIADTDPQASSYLWYQPRVEATPLPYVVTIHPAGLPDLLEKARGQGADYLFIDTPPNSSEQTLATAELADLIIVPCEPSYVDIRAIQRTAKIVTMANKPAFAILNRCPARGSEAQETREALSLLGFSHFLPDIISRAAARRAYAFNKTILEFEPKGQSAHEIKQAFKMIEKHFKAADAEPTQARSTTWPNTQTA
jgi:chromosome partitioning protein